MRAPPRCPGRLVVAAATIPPLRGTNRMIFTTEASGVLTYVGPEWEALTGQDRHAALGEGWLACLDSEDGAILRGALAEAARTRAEFTVRFRLRRVGGVSIWAVAGAVPSYGPPDSTFLGFLNFDPAPLCSSPPSECSSQDC